MTYLKKSYRYVFIGLIIALLLKKLIMAILMGDYSALIEALIYVLLLYFLIFDHALTQVALMSWAVFYLMLLTGIKAGAKTLVIMGGNGWEIDSFRYGVDLFQVGIGLFILVFRKQLFEKRGEG